MKEYVLDLKTDIDLGSKEFYQPFLEEWFNVLDSRLRPDRFDQGEPVRRKLHEEGVEAVVKLWGKDGLIPMFKRVARPKFTMSVSWRPKKGLDKRPFPWSCDVWLNAIAGDDLALCYFRFLTRHFKPAFASLTSYEDCRSKHFVVTRIPEKGMSIEKYMGLDVGETLPGIYWTTYFSTWAQDKIDRKKFDTLKAHKIENLTDGKLVTAYPSCEQAGSETARTAENQIVDYFGKEHFFQKPND